MKLLDSLLPVIALAALIAEGLSLVTQVVLRKGDTLYINDGIYGSFDELTLPGWVADYHLRMFRLDAKGHALMQPAGHRAFRILCSVASRPVGSSYLPCERQLIKIIS